MWQRTAVLVLALAVLGSPSALGQALHDVHQNAGVPCAACHQETPPSVAPADAVCVSCHGTMLGDGQEQSALSPDPHRSPHLGPGEVPACSECHRIHSQSEVTCVLCHRGFQFNVK